MEKFKIVLLDGQTINPGDLSWAEFENYGDLTVYDVTKAPEAPGRAGNANILLTSKVSVTPSLLDKCPELKYIGVTATGYNNIDIAACKQRGIAVANVPAYATDAVAQHTFAFILEICDQIGLYDASVKNHEWHNSPHFTYCKAPMILLCGKSLGIIGYGSIGKKVAEIARSFGMTVNVYSQDPEAAVKSDFVSLHCPAAPDNAGFVNKAFIDRMKDGAVLINTARGTLVDEQALADALNTGKLLAAGVDVLSVEPPLAENPLPACPNCFVTPHMAWTPTEMRKLVIDTCVANLKSFIEGGKLNRIV